MASTDEIWLLDFGEPQHHEPAGRRPALILGPPPEFGPDFPQVVVVPLTRSRRGLVIHVELEPVPTTGLHTTSYAQCELLRSVSTRRLLHRIGVLDPVTSRAVRQTVAALLGC